MEYKILIKRVEGFIVPNPKKAEVKLFTVFVPRMSNKAEREYIADYLGEKNFTVTETLKARIPIEIDVISAIENNIDRIADFFKENEEDIRSHQNDSGDLNDEQWKTKAN